MVEEQIIRVADESFEEDFKRYTDMKDNVRQKELAEAEKRIEANTQKLENILSIISHEEKVLVEKPDEESVSESEINETLEV